VTPDHAELYQVEIYPTSNVFKAGHRIRLTIGTANTPGTVTPASDLQNEAGGQLQVLRGPTHDSYVQLPVISAGSVSTGGCPLATGRLVGTRLGPVSLGMTRGQARRAFAQTSYRGKRFEDFFCLMPTGVRVGYASPKLLRALRPSRRARWRGRVVWASTANPTYSLRGIRPGGRLAAARRRLRLGRGFHVGPNWWYFGPAGTTTALLKVRQGIVKEVGIAGRGLTQGRAAQRKFITSFFESPRSASSPR
jgi:hypothetical protein